MDLELPSSIERPIPLLRENSLDTRDLGAVGGEEHACMDGIRLLIARARQLREVVYCVVSMRLRLRSIVTAWERTPFADVHRDVVF